MRLKACVLCILAVVVLALAAASPVLAVTRDDFQTEVLRLVNAERAQRGLHAVHGDRALQRAAAAHARDMLVRDYFSHTSPEGQDCGARARRAGYGTAGYRSWRLGEVIAWGMERRGTPAEVVDGWMHSSYHRSVILGKGWRDAGVACVQGDFRGLGQSFMYVVDVGRRSR